MEPRRNYKDLTEEEIERISSRVYDELRHFTLVPKSMEAQVFRNGFLSKKTIDGSGSMRFHGSRKYWKE